MKVVVAMDSFKGCISSIDGSQAVALGIHDVWPEAEVDCIPLADGGEGTVEALVAATGGKYIPKSVTGLWGVRLKLYTECLAITIRLSSRSQPRAGCRLCS